MNHRGREHSKTRHNERNAGISRRRAESVSEAIYIKDCLTSINTDLGRYESGSLGKNQLGNQIERDLGIVERIITSREIEEPQLTIVTDLNN